MIAEKIESVAEVLSGLAGRVSEEDWLTLRRAGRVLRDAADQARGLEDSLCFCSAENKTAWGPRISTDDGVATASDLAQAARSVMGRRMA